MSISTNSSIFIIIYNAHSMRDSIQPLSFNCQLITIFINIFIFLELHASIILDLRFIRKIKAREMRPGLRWLWLILARNLMALFFFLYLRLDWLRFVWMMTAIVGHIKSIICLLLIILNNLSKNIDLTILYFIFLDQQLLLFKVFLEGFNVLIEFIFDWLKLILKFLKVTFEGEKHAIKVFHDSVDLIFHIWTER